MRYSVSATCLDQDAFEDNVLALLEHQISDLHCDFFPELAGAPSLSADQLRWCLWNWPRQLTVHLWGVEGLRALPEEVRRGARLILQLHDGSGVEFSAVENALADGLAAGIGIAPGLVPAFDARPGVVPVAVQVLSTSTPGFPGGTFLPSAREAVVRLRHLRRERAERWTIEVDGGVSGAVLAELAGRCDLAVLGTNHLHRHRETGLFEPCQLGDQWLSALSS